jgi:hypothetical protein
MTALVLVGIGIAAQVLGKHLEDRRLHLEAARRSIER